VEGLNMLVRRKRVLDRAARIGKATSQSGGQSGAAE